jgi:hypothetical protein
MERLSAASVAWEIGPPILLTPEQAAEWCQVSRNILDEWTYEPGFPVLRRPGGHFVRIHRLELEKWLAERARASNPEPVYQAPKAPQRLRRRP